MATLHEMVMGGLQKVATGSGIFTPTTTTASGVLNTLNPNKMNTTAPAQPAPAAGTTTVGTPATNVAADVAATAKADMSKAAPPAGTNNKETAKPATGAEASMSGMGIVSTQNYGQSPAAVAQAVKGTTVSSGTGVTATSGKGETGGNIITHKKEGEVGATIAKYDREKAEDAANHNIGLHGVTSTFGKHASLLQLVHEDAVLNKQAAWLPWEKPAADPIKPITTDQLNDRVNVAQQTAKENDFQTQRRKDPSMIKTRTADMLRRNTAGLDADNASLFAKHLGATRINQTTPTPLKLAQPAPMGVDTSKGLRMAAPERLSGSLQGSLNMSPALAPTKTPSVDSPSTLNQGLVQNANANADVARYSSEAGELNAEGKPIAIATGNIRVQNPYGFTDMSRQTANNLGIEPTVAGGNRAVLSQANWNRSQATSNMDSEAYKTALANKQRDALQQQTPAAKPPTTPPVSGQPAPPITAAKK